MLRGRRSLPRGSPSTGSEVFQSSSFRSISSLVSDEAPSEADRPASSSDDPDAVQDAERVGKETLADVVQSAALLAKFERLNDENEKEGRSRSSSLLQEVSDGRAPAAASGARPGYIERIPFLSLLFSDRRRWDVGGPVIIDEEAASQIDNPMVDIFLWRDPLVSGLWFAVIHMTGALLSWGSVSALTLLAVLVLWQLTVDAVAHRVVVPRLKTMGVIDPSVDSENFIRKTVFVNLKLVHQYADAVREIADMVFSLWTIVVLEGDSARVWAAVRFLLLALIASFSLHTTTWLLLAIAFTLPVGYTARNLLVLDALFEGYRDRKRAVLAYFMKSKKKQ